MTASFSPVDGLIGIHVTELGENMSSGAHHGRWTPRRYLHDGVALPDEFVTWHAAGAVSDCDRFPLTLDLLAGNEEASAANDRLAVAAHLRRRRRKLDLSPKPDAFGLAQC